MSTVTLHQHQFLIQQLKMRKQIQIHKQTRRMNQNESVSFWVSTVRVHVRVHARVGRSSERGVETLSQITLSSFSISILNRLFFFFFFHLIVLYTFWFLEDKYERSCTNLKILHFNTLNIYAQYSTIKHSTMQYSTVQRFKAIFRLHWAITFWLLVSMFSDWIIA